MGGRGGRPRNAEHEPAEDDVRRGGAVLQAESFGRVLVSQVATERARREQRENERPEARHSPRSRLGPIRRHHHTFTCQRGRTMRGASAPIARVILATVRGVGALTDGAAAREHARDPRPERAGNYCTAVGHSNVPKYGSEPRFSWAARHKYFIRRGFSKRRAARLDASSPRLDRGQNFLFPRAFIDRRSYNHNSAFAPPPAVPKTYRSRIKMINPASGPLASSSRDLLRLLQFR